MSGSRCTKLILFLRPWRDTSNFLEGENHVTGSFPIVDVFQIRKEHSDAIECEVTGQAVNDPTDALLKCFDESLHPAKGGKDKHFKEDELSRGQLYIGLHRCFFFASFLDPRVLPTLIDVTNEEHFVQLKEDVISLMVSKSKEIIKKKNTLKQDE